MNQALVVSSISSLNKKVRERTGLKERKKLELHWVTYVWGTVIFLVLIGICFILINFFNKKDNAPASTERKETITVPAIQPKDTVAVSQKPDSITIDTTAKKLPVADTAKTKATTPIPQGNSGNIPDPKKPVITDTKNTKDAGANTTANKTAPTGAKAPESTPPKKAKTDTIKLIP